MSFYDGPFPQGVPNPYGARLHSYPTRYHGPIYTRPMYALPLRKRPYDFAVESGTEGLGTTAAESLPPAWKWGVALGLAGLTVWAAMQLSERKARA